MIYYNLVSCRCYYRAGYSHLESIWLDKNLSSAGWCHQEICSVSIVWKLIIICGMENDRFSLYFSPSALLWFRSYRSSQKLLRSAIFLFLILVRTPSSSPNRYALYFLSRSLLHSLSLTQITPITAHSSSPAPLSLPLHTSLQQTHTHTHTHSLSMQLFKKGIYLSASVWSWDCRRPPFIKRTAICYTAYVCVSQRRKTTEKHRESEYHQTCQEQVRLTSHHKLYI